MLEYQITTIPNGLRVLTIPQKDALISTVMMLVGVGSRHEEDQQAGIAHFIEHNVFKGTKSRSQRNQIAEEIEGLGGATNAATGHEYTYYWAKCASDKLPKILDIILDISNHMTFPERELEIERGNVIEEINMYQDNPAQKIGKDYIDFIWGGHSIGRSILGTKETVNSITQDQMRSFVAANYTVDNMILITSGNVSQEGIANQVNQFYQNIDTQQLKQTNQVEFVEFQQEPRILNYVESTQQTHFSVGFKTFGRNDERRYVLDLVNVLLGQGMSSRLFTKIREEMGLAYYIGSANWEFDETGVWFARAGVDNQRSKEAISAVLGEFKLLANEEVSAKELLKAKEYLKGDTLMGVETGDELANWYGFQELLEDEILSPLEYNQRIDEVTAEEVLVLVQQLLRKDRLNLGIIGPGGNESQLKELLDF